MKNKLIKTVLIFSFIFQNIFIVNAKTINCKENGIVIGFFNGVMTTEDEAQDSLKHIKLQYKKTQNSKGEPIIYDYLYNTTQPFLDFVEVIRQIALENPIFRALGDIPQLFFALKSDTSDWLDKLAEETPEGKEIIDGAKLRFKQSQIEYLKKFNLGGQLNKDYENHRSKINEWINEDKKLLFIAHSQGNLFANEAYKHARNFYNEKEVQVVHIAPATLHLNGEHVLADVDLVIRGLYAMLGDYPPVNSIIHIYPEVTDEVPFFRKAGLNNKKDWILGHGLLEIYLNPNLEISKSVWRKVDLALDNLTCKECYKVTEREFVGYDYISSGHWMIPPTRIPVYNWITKTICN